MSSETPSFLIQPPKKKATPSLRTSMTHRLRPLPLRFVHVRSNLVAQVVPVHAGHPRMRLEIVDAILPEPLTAVAHHAIDEVDALW